METRTGLHIHSLFSAALFFLLLFPTKATPAQNAPQSVQESTTPNFECSLDTESATHLIARKKSVDTPTLDIPSILALTDARKLELDKLAHRIATKTDIGKLVVSDLIKNPIADTNEICSRQTCIGYMYENPDFSQKIDQLLATIQNNIPLYGHLLGMPDAPTKRAIESLYTLSREFISYTNPHSVNFARSLRHLAFTGDNLKLGIVTLFALGRQIIGFSEFQANRMDSMNFASAQLIACGCHAIFAWVAYCNYHTLKQEVETFQYVCRQLTSAATIVRTVREIRDLIEKSTPEEHPLRPLPACNKLLASPIATQLLTNTFTSPSYLCNQGRVLAAYARIADYHHLFANALYEVGLLDAYRGAVRFAKQAEAAGTPWCFATFSDLEYTRVKLEHFWNPLMPPNQAVCNTTICGAFEQHKDIVLTGPNGTGKSTNMKAFAYNTAILPQTFGIACAQEAELTPFTHTAIYLDEEEDLDKNLSTFMAEQQKLRKIHHKVENLNAAQRCLVIMDEPINGTVADAAEDLVHETCTRLAHQPQCIALVATHLKRPSQAEQDTNGVVANYHVELQEPHTGSFVRTFKLIRGVNDWWLYNNDREKRLRFITWLGDLTEQMEQQK